MFGIIFKLEFLQLAPGNQALLIVWNLQKVV